MPDYAKTLNSAQYAAVSSNDDAVLVVAGAGSGKTRTIVHRLAWLVEQGVDPRSILLLTFTRKAAQEMLTRASQLLASGVSGICGGTFHSFAYGALRQYPPDWLAGRPFTLMDSGDMTQAIQQCREEVHKGNRDSSFPKSQTILSILSKARNKEMSVEEILRRDSFHLLPHAEAIEKIGSAYAVFKKERALLDYDDLLFELEAFLKSDGWGAASLRSRFSQILVDEYQDTNLVQARIVRLLAQPGRTETGEERPGARIMAVGDEAQSIYAFRGANVRNIMDFPRIFPDARVIRLEENYRSTQPILDIANDILMKAPESFKKDLFANRQGGEKPRQITTLTDVTEARLVAMRVRELLEKYQPWEIAVLFRSGFHSFMLENELRKAGIPFRKYGGLRMVEAAHIKDILAFARLAVNPLDLPAFARLALMCKGLGAKTANRLHAAMTANNEAALRKGRGRFPSFFEDLDFIAREGRLAPAEFMEKALERYRPRMEELYPDDWPSRLPGLEEILQIASGYEELDLFVADLALDAPEEQKEPAGEHAVTLSTVHSAKGLEWRAVLILDLAEDRFPSRHAQARPEDFEEERRLFYVACTRAKDVLELYFPQWTLGRGGQGRMPLSKSPFLAEINQELMRPYKENNGILQLASGKSSQVDLVDSRRTRVESEDEPVIGSGKAPQMGTAAGGYCRHRIFGRGKIIRDIDGEKMQVNFPGFGLKVILKDYLALED